MDQEAVRLARELARVKKGRGKRYPKELRGRVVAWARQRHAAGVSWQQIKRELGQQFDTVRRWCSSTTAAHSPQPRALVPVRIVEKQSASRVAVVSPNGFRVESVTLAEAAALLRELG